MSPPQRRAARLLIAGACLAGTLALHASPLLGSDDVQALAKQGDKVADLTHALSSTPLRASFKASQTRYHSPEGEPLLAAEVQYTYIVRQLDQDYLVERYVQDALQARLAKRGREYRAETYSPATGDTVIEHNGSAARSLVAAHFLPASYAQGILRVYNRLDTDDPALSLRNTDGRVYLEETIRLEHGGQVEEHVAQSWEVLEDGLLIRRATGGDSGFASGEYRGLQRVLEFPFPTDVERVTRDRNRELVSTVRLKEITVTPTDEELFRRDMGAFFE